ncbi:MAG: Ldh family oxidoreductase [Dehalococcoidia bacterium]|jgi:LDH2 family malate/lactate/ureidoglycolate dehydrogenase|nr:Ldh family oxidoreductase [Dehalococcoidia bacterium]
MLEHFHVPEKDQVRVRHADLHRTTAAVFGKMGMPIADAELAADGLVTADLRGCETHGVSNMLRAYVQMFAERRINPTPNWKITRETSAVATIDADGAHGLVMCPHAMDIAIEKASKVGIGAVTIHNSQHAGMMAYHAMRAMPHDMIGYAITGGGAVTVPTYGAVPRIGAVPHAWAIPADKMPPFVLDISSSSVAANKIQLLRRTGAKLLPGLVADEEGTPIMEEQDVPAQTRLLPWGSTRELGSHKGYGMAVIGQVFSGILSAGLFGVTNPPGNGSQFVAAYSIDAFRDVAEFKSSMDEFLTYLADTPPAPGHDRVYYAGLPEHEETIARERDGIPLHREVVEWFDSACKDLRVERLVRSGDSHWHA